MKSITAIQRLAAITSGTFLRPLAFSLSLLVSYHAQALPPEIEVDRLILAAKEKLATDNFPAAREYLERVTPLKIDPPAEYYLLYGKVYYESDAWEQAKASYEKYVELAGKEADAYEESLRVITELEETLQDKQQSDFKSATTEPTPVTLTAKQGEKYDKKVSQLYLNQDLEKSLVTHVNSLLKSYRFIEGKIKNTDRGDYIDFKLSLAKGKELVLTRRDITHSLSGEKSELTVSKLNAFGIDPNVEYRCSKESDSCTIKHPLNQKEWIKISRDEQGAEEITKALTRLLKALQRG
ncbi:MAG: hypothetical protein MI976_19435 [Pseudomonadales bacterium]|nr:hypothetical protein [Pseudomonadales bacterium]